MIVVGDLSPGVGPIRLHLPRGDAGHLRAAPRAAECMYDLGTASVNGAGTFTVIGAHDTTDRQHRSRLKCTRRETNDSCRRRSLRVLRRPDRGAQRTADAPSTPIRIALLLIPFLPLLLFQLAVRWITLPRRAGPPSSTILLDRDGAPTLRFQRHRWPMANPADRRTRSTPICSTRLSRSKILDSTNTPASTGDRRWVLRGKTARHLSIRRGASTITMQLAHFATRAANIRRQDRAGHPRRADRATPIQARDSRRVPQPRAVRRKSRRRGCCKLAIFRTNRAAAIEPGAMRSARRIAAIPKSSSARPISEAARHPARSRARSDARTAIWSLGSGTIRPSPSQSTQNGLHLPQISPEIRDGALGAHCNHRRLASRANGPNDDRFERAIAGDADRQATARSTGIQRRRFGRDGRAGYGSGRSCWRRFGEPRDARRRSGAFAALDRIDA